MFEYERPTVDNLINNLPSVLKSSRQFLSWNIELEDKKVPLQSDGRSWGNYNDPKCWRTFNDALALLDNGRAFGIGLALPSPEQIKTLPDFNLIAGLVAFDADAKRSSTAAPFKVPAHISEYVRSANSYSEFSPSLKGLRALIFGDLPTSKQCLNKPFGDGTELSLYRTGWVTLSGLASVGSSPTIEHRQGVIDHLVKELWPDLARGTSPLGQDAPASTSEYSVDLTDSFVLDWGRSAGEDLIRQFIQGSNRTPKQLQDIIATWELRRGWNHGDTPDGSMYTKRIVEEALWLRRLFGWTLQDVVDIVVTFCKQNHLYWSSGRVQKQIADGLLYISNQTRQPGGGCVDDSRIVDFPNTPTNVDMYERRDNRSEKSRGRNATSYLLVNSLAFEKTITARDTFDSTSTIKPAEKVSRFPHKSVARDHVLDALKQYRGWVKSSTVAVETGTSLAAAKKQLQRLRRAGLVDGDGRGRYRQHHERKLRKLRPCRSKTIPKCRVTGQARKSLTRGELKKRGWPEDLIDGVFPKAGRDYKEKEFVGWSGRVVRARCYWVSSVKAIEFQPWFEIERARLLRPSDRYESMRECE